MSKYTHLPERRKIQKCLNIDMKKCLNMYIIFKNV